MNMKATYAFQVVGVGLMAFGGVVIGRELPMGSIPVLCFAFGILLLAYTPALLEGGACTQVAVTGFLVEGLGLGAKGPRGVEEGRARLLIRALAGEVGPRGPADMCPPGS